MTDTAMSETTYLVVGSSHAALEAISAIRIQDAEGSLTLVTRDHHLPYSPTLLPYVVCGHAPAERVFLRDDQYFSEQHVAYRRGHALEKLDSQGHAAVLADGSAIRYQKLLLATGAEPAIPPIPGIDDVHYHVLRTLDDALRLKAAIGDAKRVVVLGGGLVGMHAAENLVKAGAQVTVLENRGQVLGGYFDEIAAGFIEKAFAENGARILTGCRVVGLVREGDGARLMLENGDTMEADLLLVATGVKPQTDYLAGSGVEFDAGILVDDAMRTSQANVWAAGDCAQARDFFGQGTILNAILPDATEQGRIAGMDMAGDPAAKRYCGGVPLNTYRFFGRHAVSVGMTHLPAGAKEYVRHDVAHARYLRAVLKDGRLLGIASINEFFDGGVMWQLIRRRIDLSRDLDRLIADPLNTGRDIMSRTWR
jgi:phenylglyoxylate dehydrogenase epsilon subunit